MSYSDKNVCSEPGFLAEMANRPFPRIEGFEILRMIGGGGIATVYQARQVVLDRIVALKVFLDATADERSIALFHDEARLFAELKHPSLANMLGSGVSVAGLPYLVMEYLEGQALSDYLKENGPLPLQKFQEVFSPALAALAAVHEAGVVHGGVKPENIILCPAGDGTINVKVVGLGIARSSAEPGSGFSTMRLAAFEQTLYTCPEQCSGQVISTRSDVYSLSCVIYEALVGKPPFCGNSSAEIMQKHLKEPAPTASELARKTGLNNTLAGVVISGLNKDPERRPANASEFKSRLNEVLEKSLHESLTQSLAVTDEPLRRYGLLYGGALLCILLVFALLKLTHLQVQGSSQRTAQLVKAHDGGEQSADEQTKMERRLKEAVKRAGKVSGQNDALAAEQLFKLAEFYKKYNRWKDAEPCLRKILALKTKMLGDEAPEVIESVAALCECYINQHEYSTAEQLLQKYLKIAEKALPPADTSRGWLEFVAGEAYKGLGRYGDAEKMFRRSLSTRELVLEKETKIQVFNGEAALLTQGDLAASLYSIASVCEKQHKFKEAIKNYKLSASANSKRKFRDAEYRCRSELIEQALKRLETANMAAGQ